MNTIILALVYLMGFFFSLGFHLEDCQGNAFMLPLMLAIFWPFVFGIAAPFSGGISFAEKRRKRLKSKVNP